MSRTDTIADAITIIRNASLARKTEAVIPFSNILLGCCNILKQEGYLENYRQMQEHKKRYIKIYLKYDGKKAVINALKRISKPGRRVYKPAEKMPNVLRGKGRAIVTTSRGVMLSLEAKKSNLGGEILFYVW